MASVAPINPASSYWRRLALPRHDALAVAGVLACAVLAFVGCALAGLSFNPPLRLIVLMPALIGSLALLYHMWRPAENRLFQILLYAALWALLPSAGTQLSFLVQLAQMPLQSEFYTAMDHAIGFVWIDWARFVMARPWLEWITRQAYLSYAAQPYVALILIALLGRGTRNARLIIAAMITLAITIVVSGLIPATEPAHAYGFKTPAWDAVAALRGGQRSGLPYIGIICFPSFHAAMAVLFTAAFRGMPRCFWPFAALNAVMLLSVPFSGDHYLVDFLAGIAVAGLAVWLSGKIVPEPAAT